MLYPQKVHHAKCSERLPATIPPAGTNTRYVLVAIDLDSTSAWPNSPRNRRNAREFLSVRGPLNIAHPIQDWLVIVQAGASDAGRQLAAEMIFASGGKLADAQRYIGRSLRLRSLADWLVTPLRLLPVQQQLLHRAAIWCI